MARCLIFAVVIGVVTALSVPSLAASPEPGSVYREYRATMPGDRWRVTDPKAGHPGAQKFLPNARITFPIAELDGAIRAEIVLDRWGGHPGTTGKRIRFNSNPWIGVAELTTTPPGHRPECYMQQDNPVVPVPRAHLREGENILEGDSGDQVCFSFRWGQWGQNAAVLRVYFDPSKKHAKGRITSPAAGSTLGENPTFRVVAEEPGDVDRVDFLAYYDGYDENGDGVFRDWHHGYFYDRHTEPTAEDPRIDGHVGTARDKPFEVEWDTRWIPDQPEGELKVIARIRGKDGMWWVTEPVEGLSLLRQDTTVKLYKPLAVPERHWVRAGRRSSSNVRIPASDAGNRAVEAAVHLRTWNGHHELFTFNGWQTETGGGNHVYAHTVRPIPVEKIQPGDNVIGFHSTTEHHGVEILWPGSGLVVRYQKSLE